jgi:hypothetical protein
MGSMIMNLSDFYNFDLTHFVMYLNRKKISSENPTSDPRLKKIFRLYKRFPEPRHSPIEHGSPGSHDIFIKVYFTLHFEMPSKQNETEEHPLSLSVTENAFMLIE